MCNVVQQISYLSSIPETSYPLVSNSWLFYPLPLASTTVFSDSMFHLMQCLQGSPILLHISGFPSFIRLNNILLHVCTIFFIIHSSVNGHSDCFYILAIVNSIAINILTWDWRYLSVISIPILLDKYTEMEFTEETAENKKWK